MQPESKNKTMVFFIFLFGVGIFYPLVMAGIFKFDIKTSIIIGSIFGVVGGVLWLATSNIKEKRRAAGK